jgi:hypothetical protein
LHREKLYKKSLLTGSDDFSYTQNEQPVYDSAIFHRVDHNKKCLEDYFVLQLRFICTDLHGASF